MKNMVLGIDVGLSGVRAAVFDDRGGLCGRGRVAKPCTTGGGDEKRLDAALVFDSVVAASRQALAAAGHPLIQCVGIGAFGPCPVLVDKDLNPVLEAPLFSLNFDAEFICQHVRAVHHLPEGALDADHALPKILWLKETEPTLFQDAVVVLDMTGFVVAKLTGRTVMDPVTSPYYLCEGIDNPLPLPCVLPAQAVAGGVRRAVAAELGIMEGTPVAVGTYDSYVDILGAGVVNSGACVILGTTLILGQVIHQKHTGEGLRLTPHIGDGWFLGGWTSTAGSLIDWANRITGNTASPVSRQESPGDAGVVVLPYFDGERAPVWDPCARGAIIGPRLSTTVADLQCAAIDGVALSALEIFRRLCRIAGTPSWLRATGGGVRNRLWTQAVADALNQPMEVVSHAGEAFGPAMLAFHTIDIPMSTPIDREVIPVPDLHDRYLELYDIYAGLYASLADTLHRLDNMEKKRRNME